MNLRVDLILESEQRSGNVLSAKSVTRAAAIGVPSLIALFVIVSLLRMRELTSEKSRLENQWRQAASRQEQAKDHDHQIKVNKGRLAELESWRRTRLNFPELLDALRLIVPRMIQLTDIRMTEEYRNVEHEGIMRVYTMSISGRADGARAKDHVESLTRDLRESHPFSNVVTQAIVPPNSFREDDTVVTTPGNPTTRRVFNIRVEFKAQPFDKDSAKKRRAFRGPRRLKR